jgi:hypothetical protein
VQAVLHALPSLCTWTAPDPHLPAGRRRRQQACAQDHAARVPRQFAPLNTRLARARSVDTGPQARDPVGASGGQHDPADKGWLYPSVSL